MAAVIAILITVATTKAQAPQLMSFQSVVRDNTGKLVASHSVGLRLSILQGSITGTAVYVETQTATSNANGLVTLQVGGGTVVSGTFSAIDWSAGPYYIKSEIDPTGGTSYLVAGTTQLLSVAYALYANKAGSTTSSSNSVSQGVKIGFASSTTWTCPAGVTQITVELWSGGGGGGASAAIDRSNNNGVNSGWGWNGYYTDYYGLGGGSGGTGGYIKKIVNVTPGITYNIIVGAAGIGGIGSGSFVGADGGDGGVSSFDNIISIGGGKGGTGSVITGYKQGTNGVNGAIGQVINYNYISGTGGSRSYIPSTIISPIPGMSAAAGVGGQGPYFSNPNNGANGNSGTNGEDGYCLISY